MHWRPRGIEMLSISCHNNNVVMNIRMDVNPVTIRKEGHLRMKGCPIAARWPFSPIPHKISYYLTQSLRPIKMATEAEFPKIPLKIPPVLQFLRYLRRSRRQHWGKGLFRDGCNEPRIATIGQTGHITCFLSYFGVFDRTRSMRKYRVEPTRDGWDGDKMDG